MIESIAAGLGIIGAALLVLKRPEGWGCWIVADGMWLWVCLPERPAAAAMWALYLALAIAGFIGWGRDLATIRSWVARGIRRGRSCVRLRTLRAPRGLVAAGDLVEFLEVVNGGRKGLGVRGWGLRKEKSTAEIAGNAERAG